MLILGIDTSCAVAAAALFRDGALLGEKYSDDFKSHSVKVLPMIEELMAENGFKPGDVELFAVVNGPGSFTGLRIGVTTAKTLAFAAGRPVVGINTLEALAASACEGSAEGEMPVICSLVDARNNSAYSDIYIDGQSQLGCEVRPIDEIVAAAEKTAADTGRKLIFAGDVKDYCTTGLSGAALCRLAELHQSEAVSAEALKVEYFRKTQAERMKNA